jgi:CRP-like cAMP-binding protein
VLCERLRQTTEQVEDLMFLDLPGRLAKVLLRLAPPQEGEPVRITQRELGEIVGISRERINKQLRAWQSQRLVDLETGGVIIRDAAALARQLEA